MFSLMKGVKAVNYYNKALFLCPTQNAACVVHLDCWPSAAVATAPFTVAIILFLLTDYVRQHIAKW